MKNQKLEALKEKFSQAYLQYLANYTMYSNGYRVGLRQALELFMSESDILELEEKIKKQAKI